MKPSPAELLAVAREAMRSAYAPYSGFRVGAAVLAKSGRVYAGCNVENSSYGLSMCAERVAAYKAVSEGEEVAAVAVACESQPGCAPCGACRQVIFELNPDAVVVMEGKGGRARTAPIAGLLPEGFRLETRARRKRAHG